MSEPDRERSSFEDVARALADEVSGAIERLSEIDLDEIARAASAEGQRARQWIDDLGRWLREQGGPWEHGPAPADRSTPGRPTGDDTLRHAGPHPLDLPTPDQGVALAALDSGRWRVEPGTSALAVHGEGRPQRRARARPRAASSRLDDRRRSSHAGRPRRAEPVARRCGSLTDPSAPSRPSARARRRAGAGSYGARRQVAACP